MRYRRNALPARAAAMTLGGGPLDALQQRTESWLDGLIAAAPYRLFRCLGTSDFGAVGSSQWRCWGLLRHARHGVERPDNRQVLYWWRGYGKWPNAY